MFVGNSNVGKTSLLMNLTRKGKITRFKEVERGLNKQLLSTVGVDLGDWECSTRKPKITFMTWDFGGQEEYYATHQCFLTQRSLYVLVWDVRHKVKGLESIRAWMENIGVRFHKFLSITFLIIGTSARCSGDCGSHPFRQATFK